MSLPRLPEAGTRAATRRRPPWDRIPLLRWMKSSLPGRISAVFLLGAIVTVSGLLYATPRLERTLVAPRERSVVDTLERGTFIVGTLPGLVPPGASPQEYPAVLQSYFGSTLLLGGGGLGSATQRVGLYLVEGDPKNPTVTDLDATVDDPASAVTRQAATTDAEVRGVTTVDGVARVEAAQGLTLSNGYRIVLAVWQEVDDIQRTVEIAQRRILIAGIGGASIALMLGIWVTTRLTRRIRALEAGARMVARGDFTAQFRSEGSLELAQLASALDEMQRQLAELESARRRFIATASHELRTPLSTLQGFLELLEDDDLPATERREFVAHASQQAQRLGKLASDLLDLSRLDVGSVKVRRAPTDVGLLLEGLLTEFKVAAEQHESELRRTVDPRAETAIIDADRILQLLRALVNNALTHTPSGTPITVAARRAGARVLFTVTDTGPGIPADRQRTIFEAFVTSDETKGSGLGLAIGRELARRMQGDLTVSSTPGETVFTLSVPG